jgi:hypothetical protein
VDRAKMPTQTTIALDGCHPASQYKIEHIFENISEYSSNFPTSGGSTTDGEKR